MITLDELLDRLGNAGLVLLPNSILHQQAGYGQSLAGELDSEKDPAELAARLLGTQTQRHGQPAWFTIIQQGSTPIVIMGPVKGAQAEQPAKQVPWQIDEYQAGGWLP